MSGHSPTTVIVSGATGGFPSTAVRRAVTTVLAGEGRDAFVAVTFLGLRRMRQLNRDYKHHDRPQRRFLHRLTTSTKK